jgi:hypothetical protein
VSSRSLSILKGVHSYTNGMYLLICALYKMPRSFARVLWKLYQS